ncbi:DUF4019 domain-containing protein [Tsuneonella flava]|uniref:DUF4019 domain-containing protein n=2 Tax=Tsuneonella TaxID=2800686 RepID=A0A419QYL0_9SPHN|nr:MULTISPECIES: DUF4019 domain-containing protein [Tsuneonella]QSB44986.1 DUF4019 domain-containing protein [Tsuneonella flava]RJX65596.1 DUF4019 domain-containing protein [Tsuneonella suprasediminis]
MGDGLDALTDKEKQTLRLIVRGYDAKSAARHLDISVHTVNERLRGARRKLEVSSSREAARMLMAEESATPDFLARKNLGEAESAATGEPVPLPGTRHGGGWGVGRTGALLIGGIAMSLLAAALLLSAPLMTNGPMADGASPPSAEDAARDSAVEAAARNWLALGDAGNWQGAFDSAGKSFHDANTVAGWAEASQQVRVPLGAVVSRDLQTIRYLNAPPHGFQEVRFRTTFANKADVIETVTLQKEGGAWKVVGILID